MIIKYKHEGNWGFIDGLTNVVKKYFSQKCMMIQFMDECKNKERIDPDFEEEYSTEVKIHNQIYTIASEEARVDSEECVINFKGLLTMDHLPTEEYEHSAILLVSNLSNRTEFDKIVLFSNDEVYLLNEEGKIIERLN